MVHNPAPPLPAFEPRERLRMRLGIEGPTLVLAGRLTEQKAIPVALDALSRVPGVSLVVAGDGPDRQALEQLAADLDLGGRVQFVGSLERDDVLRLFHASDGALLSSAWENFPHTVVEALAAGAPVIATAVGGVPEVVDDGDNGLLVPPGDAEALARAIERYLADDELRGRLRANAAPSVAGYAPGILFGRIEEMLEEAVARP